MPLPSVDDANYPTVVELRDAILRTIKLGFQRIGVDANVLEGSENYIRADAFARLATPSPTDAAALNLYPEDLEVIAAKTPTIVASVESMS